MAARITTVSTSREPDIDQRVAAVAAAIAEPSRARMLSALMDGRARTATELAVVAAVAPSTASAHLATLRAQRLIECVAQGKHRYFTVAGPEAAAAVEALFGVAGGASPAFAPRTPSALRYARTCYDHAAGELAVALHDRLFALKWLARPALHRTAARGARDANDMRSTRTTHATHGARPAGGTSSTNGTRGGDYTLTPLGEAQLSKWEIDCVAARSARRRLACACLDWSERRAHLGGALGAALLTAMLEKKWLRPELDSRALELTDRGRRGLATQFGLETLANNARRGAA